MAQLPLGLRLALLSLLFNLGLEASGIFMPLYAQSVGATNLEVGFVMGAWGVAYFVSSLIFGKQSDIHGRVVFIRLGFGLAVVAYLSQMVASAPGMLIAARFFVGFCLGITSGAIMAYTYENQKQVGRFASYGSVGWVVGALIAALVRNYVALFFVSAFGCAVAFVVSMTLVEAKERVPVISSVLPLLKKNRKLYLSFVIRQFGGYAIFAVFPIYMASLGASKFWIGMFDVINDSTQVIAMRLAERYNAARVFRFGIVLSTVVFATYGLASDWRQLIPVQIMLGVAWSCIFVGALSYLMQKNTERGTVAGLLYSSTYFSAGIGPFLGGSVSQVWGLGTMMYIGAAITFTGFLTSLGLKKDDGKGRQDRKGG